MQKISDLELYPDCHCLQVHNADLEDGYVYHYLTDETVRQGFYGFSGSYNFYSIGYCLNLRIEVWSSTQQENIRIETDTVRAIRVPFACHKSGIKIASPLRDKEYLIEIPQGEYVLVFEIKLRNDEEYLNNSEEYKNNVRDGVTQEQCRLTFYSQSKLVEPQILRIDAWSMPPYHLEGYLPLNPTYPLLLREEKLPS
jgi:hypothetical protein